jgi:predicted DNA-binding transcriptional regulator YafY
MARKDRLIALIGILRDARLHQGAALARALSVTPRTIYRDMATLMKSGVPVVGERGVGYRMSAAITLPPLNLSMAEMEALHLGLAVMTEADDPGLRDAARALAHKIDQALPEDRVPASTGWGLALFPFADTAAGIRHMPAVRDAIRTRKKLRLTYTESDGSLFETVVRPLKIDYWGRVWTLSAWCERSKSLRNLRIDRISDLTELPVGFRPMARQ